MNLTESKEYGDTADISWSLVSIYNIGTILTLVLNPFALMVIHQQVEINDVTRLLFRILMYANMVLGTSWNLWSLMWVVFFTPRGCMIQVFIFPFIYRTSMVSVTACLCLISLNKYYLLARPLRYHSLFFIRHIKVVLIVIQSLCCLWCSMFLPIPGVPFVPALQESCENRGHSFLQSWVTILLSLNVAVPVSIELVMTTILDILILRIAKSVRRDINNFPVPLNNLHPHHPDQRDLPRLSATNVIEGARDTIESGPSSAKWNVSRPRPLTRRNNSARGGGLRTRGVLSLILLTLSFYVCWVPVLLYFLIPDVVLC